VKTLGAYASCIAIAGIEMEMLVLFMCSFASVSFGMVTGIYVMVIYLDFIVSKMVERREREKK
jgi:hypothetical protein